MFYTCGKYSNGCKSLLTLVELRRDSHKASAKDSHECGGEYQYYKYDGHSSYVRRVQELIPKWNSVQ